MDEADVNQSVLMNARLDAGKVIARTQEADMKAELTIITESAFQQRTAGSPSSWLAKNSSLPRTACETWKKKSCGKNRLGSTAQ